MTPMGFVLIEILVGLVLLMIFFSTAMPNLVAIQRGLRDKELRLELTCVRDAANVYFKAQEPMSYDGVTLHKLAPYGYLHFPNTVVNLIVINDMKIQATVTSMDIRRSMIIDSNTGEVNIQ